MIVGADKKAEPASTIENNQSRVEQAAIGQKALVYAATLVYALVFCIIGLGWLTFQFHVLPEAYIRDFMGEFVGARLIANGQGQQLYDLALQRQTIDLVTAPYTDIPFFIFVYPAYVGLLFAPLGFLSYLDAFSVMTVVNFALLAVTLWQLLRVAANTKGVAKMALLFAAAGFVPVTRLIWQGQLSLWPLLGLTGAVLALRSGHERQAGAWLLLGLIKPQLIVLPLLYLALEKRWKALGIWAAGLAALVVASVALFGNWLPGYVNLLFNAQAENSGTAGVGDMPQLMQNWRGLVYSLFGSESGATANILYVFLIVASIAAVVVIGWRWPRLGKASMEARFAVAVLLGILIVPHLYAHDITLALLPGFMLWNATGLAVKDMAVNALRLALGVGPLVVFAGQFVKSMSQVFPWYALVLLALVALCWNKLGQRDEAAQESAIAAPGVNLRGRLWRSS